MSRPRKYNDEEILQAAAEVFLEHGATAGTALIAKRAGVSEGVLFQRFKNKEALFEAAMTMGTESDQWRETLLAGIGRGSPHANLKKAILALFDKLQRFIPRLMILEGRGHQRPFPSGAKPPPLEDARAISAYLEGEVAKGRLKIEHPELHAHEIVGAVVHCTMLKLRHQIEVYTIEQWADHLTRIHLAETSKPGGQSTTPRHSR